MITRPSNANKHPGDIQRLSGARRPKEVVAAERAAKTAVKEKAAAAKESAIQKVAKIENNARKKHTSSRLASQVADKLTIPRVARARKTVDEQELKGKEPKFGVKANNTIDEEDEGLPDEQSDDDETKQSDERGSNRGDQTPDEESQSSYESDMDEDEEIEGTSSIRKTSRKKQKGLAVRAKIDTVAAEMLRQDEPNVEVMKRKAGVNASADTETLPPCKKKLKTSTRSSQEGLSGVVSGWKKNKPPQGNVSRAPSSASTRMTVSRRASSTIPMDSEDGTSDGPAFAYGGIPSDEEDLERPGLEDSSAMINRYRAFAP
ncbi:hypothetical protein BC826DRAFT_976344 [Russula brevipes]|nr:hypothetical protein BC826DRAFT_976344 [Russula brevipes]